MLSFKHFEYVIKIKEKIQKIKSKNHLSLKSEIKEIRIYRDPFNSLGVGIELTVMKDNTYKMLKAWARAKDIVFVDKKHTQEGLDSNNNININLI